jgi:two-component system, NtrC family, response regulator HydG
MPHLLMLVHDEPAALQSLYRICKRDGVDVLGATSAGEALAILAHEPVTLCLVAFPLDHAAAGFVQQLHAVRDDVAVVWLATSPAVADVVAVMRAGAADVLVRGEPAALQAAISRHWRSAGTAAGSAPGRDAGPDPALLGRSPAIREVIDLVDRVGPSSATVLIQGESGTGKELVAHALQQRSLRAAAPFVKVNCAALPEGLMESELFGHERGAFTGAVRARKGRFELADGGTIFLDEIGDMSPGTQMKVLRVLQEGEIDRVGGTRTQHVDVRVIAATNIDLGRAVAERRFREDLYYRLRVIEIRLPPLRERKEDIPPLVELFVQRFAARNAKTVHGVHPEALELLLDHDWPGNVRELENAVERAVVLARGERLTRADFTSDLERRRSRLAITFTIGTTLAQIERRMIAETLRYAGGDKRRAATLLGITARTIYRKLERRRAELQDDAEPAAGEAVPAAAPATGASPVAASVGDTGGAPGCDSAAA